MLHYGEVLYWPPWAELLSHLNHLLLGINSSSNIVIYVAKVGLVCIYVRYHLLTIFSGFQVPACSLPELELQEGGGNRKEDEQKNIHHLDHQGYLNENHNV